MAGIDYTTDGIIADVKRNGAIPSHQSLFEEDDFIAVLSDEMKTIIVPLLLSIQENHFQTEFEYTILVGEDHYSVPWRAIGNKLKSVEIWDAGKRLITLPRLDIRDIANDCSTSFQLLSGFRMEGTDVVLYPMDTWVGKTLRLTYFRRPNDLVPTSKAGKIVAIDRLTGEIQLDNVPSDWTTTDTFDMIPSTPPFKQIDEEVAITAINGLVLTFAVADIPATLAVGDWIAIKGQSPIPQIPYDAFPLLSARGVAVVLGTLSPQQGQQAEQQYAGLAKMYVTLISPRVDDAPKKLVNRKGIWQGGGGRWRN
jgi:hypothetical protein